LKGLKNIFTVKGLLVLSKPLTVFFVLFSGNIYSLQAQYHVCWTRTFKENYHIIFYPAETQDGFLFSNIERGTFKIAKISKRGKLLFDKEILPENDSEFVDYRDFYQTKKGQLFHNGYGNFGNNTRESTCFKKVDNNYITLGFGGLINKYKKQTGFLGYAGFFEFTDSSIARIELAEIEKWELDFKDLVFTKYDKNANLISTYINKDWETRYYDYAIGSSLRWKTFSVNDTTLMVYGGHFQKDSAWGTLGFLILDGNGKIRAVKDVQEMLNVDFKQNDKYYVLDVTYHDNKFFILYMINQLNNVVVDIKRVFVCNSNFDSITSYPINNLSHYMPFYGNWQKQNVIKILAYKDDTINNKRSVDKNKEFCFLDTLAKEEKCFKLKDILGNEHYRINTSMEADYNTFSLDAHLATSDGGLLLIYINEFPIYDPVLEGFFSKRETIFVKISPGNGQDTIGHEADDTVVVIPPIVPEKELILFPNPSSSSTLNMNTNKWQSIEVYNTIGQLTKIYQNTSKPYYTIDVSSLAAGNYFLKIKINDQSIYKRLLRY
jgi:hypothetical protein